MGTARLGTLKRGEEYFRPIAVFDAADDGQSTATSDGTGTVLVAAGDPKAIGDDAEAYFDRQLGKPHPALLRSRYADFLYDQTRYYAGDYISALLVLTPRVEGVLRSMLWQETRRPYS